MVETKFKTRHKTVGFIIDSSRGLIHRDIKEGNYWLGVGCDTQIEFFETYYKARYVIRKLKKDWKNEPFEPKWYSIKRLIKFEKK